MSSRRASFAFFRRARFRLTLYYTVIQFLFLVVLCGFLYYRANRGRLSELEKFLKDEVRDLMFYVVNYAHDRPYIERLFREESVGERYYDLSFRLLDRTGKVLASSRMFREDFTDPIGADALSRALQGQATTAYVLLPDHTSHHLLMASPFDDPKTGEVAYVVQALAYLEPLDKLRRRFRHNIYSAIPVFFIISWFGGYALARKVLKPVHEIARTARQITSARLDERLVRSESGDEFDMLAATLNEMIERLEQSFALLRQFAADAAHELRTPLTIMKGEAEVALRGDATEPRAYRAVLESNIRECDRMIGIISNLLLLSQADTGDIPLERQPLRLDELLRELAETFQILMHEADLTLEMGAMPPIVVQGDRSWLRELFANFLDNAVKYTPAGGRVSITCQVEPAEVRISVADTGIGIAEDQHERIFDRFYRADSSRSRETGGSGLGLSIARWIATAHGGSIRLHSALGAGSTFTVTLPLASPAQPHEPTAPAAGGPDHAAPNA